MNRLGRDRPFPRLQRQRESRSNQPTQDVVGLEYSIAARVGGAALGTLALINGDAITLYLALFAGFVIYIATAHILPEAHANHPTRWTLLATLSGIGLMWLLVAHGA